MKNKRLPRQGFRLALLSAAVCSLHLPSAHADEAAAELPSVVVTASGYEQKIKQAPASISVITRAELEKMPVNNLADAVRKLEGVSIIGGDPSDTDIAVRGLPGEYTLILVDGKRQNTRETMNRGTGGVQPYQMPPLEAIERIEVVRGPMSSLYGADAMGGVVNIITRKSPKEWHGSMTLGGSIPSDAKYGNAGETSFWAGGPLKEGLLALQVYGSSYHRSESSVSYPNVGAVGVPDTQNGNFNAKLSITPTANQDIVLEAGHNSLSYTNTPGKSAAADDDKSKVSYPRDNWGISHNGRWGWGKSSLSLYQESSKEVRSTNNVESPVQPKIVNTTLDGQLTLPFERNTLKLGMQWQQQKLSGVSLNNNVPNQNFAPNPDRIRADSSALYAENEFAATENLTLTGGLRLDHQSQYGSHVSPRLYAVYNLTPAVTLRGGVAQGFKAPKLRQTAPGYCMTSGGPREVGGVLCGNPDLKPEESTSGEIGIRYDGADGLSGSFTVFHSQFKNKVVSFDTGVVSPQAAPRTIYVYDNVDKVDIQGVEMSGAWEVNKQWKLSGNYTYTDSRRQGGKETSLDKTSLDGKPLDKTPEHVANLKLDWTPFEKLNAYANATYTGKSYWAAFRNYAMSVRERPAATTVDLGLSYQINKTFSVNAAVLNVSDKIVAVDQSASPATRSGNWMVDEGRRYWLTLTGKF
ncbi:TonB-dependent receptor domain-containing protein [Chromobacterium paludis]|uniref:TonB-dependent receptor n=1 Tax=Chromobacterium paludis TaxID=2605945 RepID=A0A5C1DD31_9NEIS|nr:TonB-dependent receptor [Chromobacterium paludis]QEL54550.1 TonB-dependent receptor [Chromobacterium paludis]